MSKKVGEKEPWFAEDRMLFDREREVWNLPNSKGETPWEDVMINGRLETVRTKDPTIDNIRFRASLTRGETNREWKWPRRSRCNRCVAAAPLPGTAWCAACALRANEATPAGPDNPAEARAARIAHFTAMLNKTAGGPAEAGSELADVFEDDESEEWAGAPDSRG